MPRKPIEKLPFVPSDGGRSTAPGFGPAKRDCVTRAIALATGRPYASVWRDMKPFAVRGNPDRGVYTQTWDFKAYMRGQGFVWTSCLSPKGRAGSVRLRVGDLPTKGQLCVSVRGHMQAVLDGVLHDGHYCLKPVVGYWSKGVPVVRS